jgi:dTDP-4-dehydrorhamnose reductase
VRVLVLGANGQLGSDLVAAAREQGIEAMPLHRADLDLDHPGGVDDALRDRAFDVLINCTGQHRTDAIEAEPGPAFTVNAHAVDRLARACDRADARFLHVSTDYVFDGAARRPYREEDQPAPINVYGASKLMGEAMARTAHPAGTLVVRTASLFGIAGSSGKGGNFVETMIRVGTERGELKVVDDIVMSPTATADLARAILDLLREDAPAGTYHVVNQGQASWYDFARAIVARAGIPAEVTPVPALEYPTRARRPPYSVLDSGKATAAGCCLRPWQEALDDYLGTRDVDYRRDHPR